MERVKKKAFRSSSRHWEFECLAFGLKTAPACFQKMINTALSGFIGIIVQVFFDGIVILGEAFSEPVSNLKQV